MFLGYSCSRRNDASAGDDGIPSHLGAIQDDGPYHDESPPPYDAPVENTSMANDHIILDDDPVAQECFNQGLIKNGWIHPDDDGLAICPQDGQRPGAGS